METAALQRFNEGAATVIRATFLASDNVQQGLNEAKTGTLKQSLAEFHLADIYPSRSSFRQQYIRTHPGRGRPVTRPVLPFEGQTITHGTAEGVPWNVGLCR